MNFFQRIPLFIFNIMFPSKIIGKENLPKGGAVIACNHFSILDPAYLLNFSKKDLYFLAKEEVFRKKLVGKILSSYGGIPINRDKPSMKSLLTSVRILKDGKKLVIFPEGTRNKSETTKLQEIKGGTVVFAIRAKTPIVPVMILKKPKIFRKTYIIIGKPFELASFYDVKLTDEDIVKLDDILCEKMIEQHKILQDMVKERKNASN